MTSIMKYSVLRYSPSKVAGEKINIGILFSDRQGKRVEFRHTSNWQRVKSFDDELDINTLKSFVEGVKLDVDYAMESGASFDLEKYIKFFINGFMFEREQKIQYDDWENTVKKLNSIYLRFDLERKN